MNQTSEGPTLTSLDELRGEFARVAEADGRSPRRSHSRRPLLLLAIALIVIPSGYAVAQALQNDGVPGSQCPEANAVYAGAGLAPPDEYAPDCPDPDELQAAFDSATVTETSRLEEIREALEQGRITEDQDPSTYPEDLQR